MLGNNADDFMMKPMPTTVTTQASSAQAEMPAPRDTSRVDQNEMLPGMGEEPQAFRTPTSQQEMLPGMGAQDMLPGMGNFDLKNPALWAVGGGLAFLFLTKSGKKMRRKVGLG